MRRPQRAEVALALAIMANLVADVYALTTTNATTVAVSEAVRRFREAPGGATTAQPSQLGSAPPSPDPPPTTPAPSPSAAPTTAASTSLPRPPPSSAPAGASGSALRPPAGVYGYDTDGFESVSILGAQRRYPPETTRTVRHGAGCIWSFRIILLEEHQEEHVACSRPGILDLTGSTNDVRWFGLSTTTRLTCDPPIRHVDAAGGAGSTAPFVCREGVDSTFSGTTALLGEEAVAVGGQTRRAWRLSVNGTFQGKTRGTVAATELIDQDSGITLFEQRVNDLKQQSPIGDIAYHQEVTLRLRSLSPAA
jgi:hypothetical protein